MASVRDVVHVDLGKELTAMVDQRAKQEGITRSEYIREAVILELVFSGDVSALGFVAKKVGKRMKTAILDRLGHADLSELGSMLAK